MIGDLPEETLSAILNQLPVRVTFIDSSNVIQVRNELCRTPERDPAKLVGNSVFDCHTPESIPKAEKLIADLRSGNKRSQSMIVRSGGKAWQEHFAAIHDKQGNYLGVTVVRYPLPETGAHTNS